MGLVKGRPNDSPDPRGPGFDRYEPRESCTLHAILRLTLPSVNDASLLRFNRARDPRSSPVIVPCKRLAKNLVYTVLPSTARSAGRLVPWQTQS
jgi:hypothetical protein